MGTKGEERLGENARVSREKPLRLGVVRAEEGHSSARRCVGCFVCVSSLNSATPIARDVNRSQAREGSGKRLPPEPGKT